MALNYPGYDLQYNTFLGNMMRTSQLQNASKKLVAMDIRLPTTMEPVTPCSAAEGCLSPFLVCDVGSKVLDPLSTSTGSQTLVELGINFQIWLRQQVLLKKKELLWTTWQCTILACLKPCKPQHVSLGLSQLGQLTSPSEDYHRDPPNWITTISDMGSSSLLG